MERAGERHRTRRERAVRPTSRARSSNFFEADATFTHVELLAQPAEARVSILLYDALDFSTDRDDGGGQTRESLSRIA